MTTQNIYEMVDVWNNVATAFTAIEMDVNDVTSLATSLLLDLKVGGTSKFSILKNGIVEAKFINVGASSTTGVSMVANRAGLSLGSAAPISFTDGAASVGTEDIILLREAAATLAQRDGANPQTFNIYNTWTDASNYERGVMKWASNVLEVGTEAAGTGTQRVLKLLGFDLEIWPAGNKRWVFESGGVFRPNGNMDIGQPAGSTVKDFFLIGGFHTLDAGELTISSGAIAVTGTFHTVDTESDAASDVLDDITVGGGVKTGRILILQAEHTDRSIVVTRSSTIKLSSATVTLADTESTITLIYSAALSAWVEIANSANS